MPRSLPNEREAIFLAILMGGQEKYGREILKDFEVRSNRKLPIGSLYTTLDRIEAKGFLRSREGEPNPELGGNRRRFYKITGAGVAALNELRQMMTSPGVTGAAHA
ncbi:MAG: PadR family transcriptional regulator [Tepidisphaeraceae bacterium]